MHLMRGQPAIVHGNTRYFSTTCPRAQVAKRLRSPQNATTEIETGGSCSSSAPSSPRHRPLPVTPHVGSSSSCSSPSWPSCACKINRVLKRVLEVTPNFKAQCLCSHENLGLSLHRQPGDMCRCKARMLSHALLCRGQATRPVPACASAEEQTYGKR